MPRARKKNKCGCMYSEPYPQYGVPGNDAYRQIFTRQYQEPFVPAMMMQPELPNTMPMPQDRPMPMPPERPRPMPQDRPVLRDHGGEPYVADIEEATKMNDTFRTALWTGEHLQLTLMSLEPGEDIGLEVHPDVDQFLRIEQGQGMTMMGGERSNLDYQRKVKDNSAVFIPAGTWHNLVNTGDRPLRLYSIYAPPNHSYGTVHGTKTDAEAAEHI